MQKISKMQQNSKCRYWGDRDEKINYIISGICLCLSPDRTWHKVNDPKVGLKWELWEREVERCWTLLVIGSLSAMRAWWAYLDMGLNMGPGTDAR